MQKVPLAVVANQKFSIRLDNRRYVITIKSTNGVMSATIVRDGITVISGQRCVAQTPLLPYLSTEASAGNFIFFTLLDELPDYKQFNTTQYLFYATNDELEAIRNG